MPETPAPQQAILEANRQLAALQERTAHEEMGPSRFASPVFQAQLDRTTGSRPHLGNEATALFDGIRSFAERKRLILSAKHSINFQTFIFSSDHTGWELARLLADKAREGVKVRVIIDGLGSKRADPRMLKMMVSAGVELRTYGDNFAKFWELNDRWHEKHLIVDGEASIEGGMNVASEYALGGSGLRVFTRPNGEKGVEAWRDTDILLRGPAVNEAQRAFLRNWDELGSPVPAAEAAQMLAPQPFRDANATVRVVQHRPFCERDTHVEALYLAAIANARHSITIENAYFVPSAELRQALIDAARRGVRVRIMTNSRESNDFAAVCDAGRYFYDELLAAGVEIYEKVGGTLHAKTATFDGAFSVIGSANLNGRSRGRDTEVVVAVLDNHMADQLEERFETGLRETRQILLSDMQHQPLMTRLRQFACSTLAWTF